MSTYEVGTPLTFTAKPGAKYYLWDFGDGSTSAERIASYTYTEPGTYTVTLSLWNKPQQTKSSDQTVTITGVEEPPPPEPPGLPGAPLVSTRELRQTEALLRASWDAAERADRYEVEAGSDAGRWRLPGWQDAGAALHLDFSAPRPPAPSADDHCYVSVRGVNEVGPGVARGGTFIVPAQVPQQPPPLPNPGRPNEPVGFMRWLEHDMSYLPGGGALSHAGFAGASLGGKYAIVTDTKFPGGPRPVARITYPEGQKDGNSPGRFWAWDKPSQAAATELREWYISLWVYMEPNPVDGMWEMPPAALKLWYNGVGRRGQANAGGSVQFRNGLTALAKRPGDRIVYTWRTCRVMDDGRTCVISDKTSPGSPVPEVFPGWYVGGWMHLEQHVKLSTPGVIDGRIRGWRNGVQTINEAVQNQHPDDWTTGFYELHWAPIWGGSCSSGCPKTRDDSMRIGPLYISGIPK